MSRMSTRRSRTSPMRRNCFSSRTFRSFGWTWASTSPISSRKIVPRCATSRRPGLAAVAPVNAPLSWPKSSVSRNSRERPAQFRSTNGSSARGPFSCSQRARTPLPAPVSPWIRTGLSDAATLRASAARARIAALVPRKGSRSSRERRERLAICCCRLRWFSMRRSTITVSASSCTGLVRNCSAPSLIARTARSTEPWAVRMRTGTVASSSFRRGRSSRALPSGSE